ncbi:MAG: carbohydrate binding domain-containing protein [Cytophagaceae bacterium]|nr:carbohydrate binding domain-containing protein [Cytophagaceae bacterium]MDW8455578.1 carbohydrate binding domain-containing protein [Cytophagaceae bacterium]
MNKFFHFTKLPLCLIFFSFPFSGISQTNAVNQLSNPGFEKQAEEWNMWGAEVQSNVVRSGSYAAKIMNTTAKWSGADQIIFLPEGTYKVEINGWMKTENVKPGEKDYEQARIAIEFLDQSGTLTGGYPPVTGKATGSTDWKYYTYTYFPSKAAKQLKLQIQLANCTGTAYYDDLEVFLYNDSGEPLEAATLKGPMDEGKWYTITIDTKRNGSHYVDWSSLLDAPAGKHGFAKVVDGHFQFEDGTPIKFWGVNLVASSCFPEKKVADSLATRLARMGCNIVRLHHLDAPWYSPNIFGNAPGTRQLSAESMDKLDYLIAALKKKGIYIFMDLLVHRNFTQSDGILFTPPDYGGKQIAYFNERIIDLQKEYITQLLTHKNPYTGLAYVDDPAIVGSEFINESSAFLHFGSDILTEPYRKELNEKFQQAYPGKKMTVFDLDYSKGNSPVLSPRKDFSGDHEATIRFLSEVEKKYYRTMYTHMRNIGVKYPLSGSNFPIPILPYQYDNTVNDFIITNDYWDHPQIWKINNDWSRILYAPLNNTSMIANPSTSTINNIMKYKWYKKPFIVTEFNACYPNEYILEALPLVAAYSSLQDNDGLIQFDFGPTMVGEQRMGGFSTNLMPDHLAQWVVAAPIFLRGDIKKAPGLVTDSIAETQLYTLPAYSDFLDKHFYLSYITKVCKSYGDKKTGNPKDFLKYYDESKKIIQSETGELTLDFKKNILKIDAANVQGALGNTSESNIDCKNFSVKLKNKWASAILISKQNKPISESSEFYLVVVTPTKMSGQVYNKSRNVLSNPGSLPLKAQVAEGEVELKLTAQAATVTALNPDGTKGKNINATIKNNLISIKLNEGKSFVYEIKLTR